VSTALQLADRETWLQQRMLGIGASEASTILGLNPYKSAYTLWAEKTGLIEAADLSDNEAVEWGIELEPLVAKKYAKATGRELMDPGRFTIQRHSEIGWMIASLDRIIQPIDNRGPGALEIKTTGGRHAAEWEEDAPVGYQVQLMHQLAVTGFQWGSLAVLIAGQQFRYIDYPRNDDFIRYLIAKEANFWNRVTQQEPPDPPAVDGSDSTRDALAKLYPRDKGTTCLLPPEAAGWIERRAAAKAAIKAADTEVQECENCIKAAIGEHSIGLMGNGLGFSYRLQKRAGYTVQPKEFRVLREIRS
jgi:putative phage-type endonuclease